MKTKDYKIGNVEFSKEDYETLLKYPKYVLDGVKKCYKIKKDFIYYWKTNTQW